MKIGNRLLPDFFIVGAQKAATTTLYHILKQHNEVFLPVLKEPTFFTFRNEIEKATIFNDTFRFTRENVLPMTDLDAYADLFKKAGKDQIIGEASTHYLYDHNTCIANIKEVYGNDWDKLKIIILLRNPVMRAFSAWSMLIRNGAEDLSFLEAVKQSTERKALKRVNDYDYVGFGMYYHQVKAYTENFSDVKVFLQEELEADVNVVTKETLDFLGLHEQKLETNLTLNVSGMMKNRRLAKFLYTDSKLKKLIKQLVPLDFGINLKAKIEKRFVKKMKIEKADEIYIKGLFKEDANKLAVLIDRPEILKWVE